MGVTFSPDGSRLATSSFDSTAVVWDLASGQEMLNISMETAPLTKSKFSADGSKLLISDSGGILDVIALNLEDIIELVDAQVTRTLTDIECQQYLNLDTCPVTE